MYESSIILSAINESGKQVRENDTCKTQKWKVFTQVHVTVQVTESDTPFYRS